MSKLVILGRDGVINHYHGHAIASADDWTPIPGSLEAIARLTQAGYRVAVATNQPGLAAGLFDLDALNAIHHKLHQQLDRIGGHVDVIAYCPHSASQGCECRKPATGMFRQIAERFGIDLAQVAVISARSSDIQAAQSIGAHALLVRSDRPDQPDITANLDDQRVFDDLSHAINTLLVED